MGAAARRALPGALRGRAGLRYETRNETQTVRIDDVFGNHTRPPGADAVLAKFRANAARSVKINSVGALEQATQDVAAANHLRALSAALHQIS